MLSLLQEICYEVGFTYQRAEQVFGGDINQAWCVYTNQGKYFVKLNGAVKYPLMFAREAEGLQLLQNKSGLAVPTVIAVGQVQDRQWLMLDWLEKGTPSTGFWKSFGIGLAGLHRNSQTMFGLHADNYIGSLRQSNKPTDSWATFYLQERILPLSVQLFDRGSFSQKEIKIVEKSEGKLSNIFPQEPPALLHGDLWSGNFMIGTNGPVIYDPAVYYGHREMDIGMSLLFGGFDRVMYEAYNDAWPLEKNWKSRVPITQLYPLLVHAVLFGGHYIKSAAEILAGLVE
jgi:fructosamine-3-kinase